MYVWVIVRLFSWGTVARMLLPLAVTVCIAK